MKTLLISETTLKTQTAVNANVNPEYIVPSIHKAQDIGLQPLIGTKLYRKMCDIVADHSIYTSGGFSHYKTLLDDYITPYLCNKVMAELQIVLFAKIRNAGVITSQDQQTQQLSQSECEYIRKKYDYDADFYGTRLTDYLCVNSSLFPEYCQRESVADLPHNPMAFNTHIVL